MQSSQDILLEINLIYTQKHTVKEESQVCRPEAAPSTLSHQNRETPLVQPN